MIETIITNFNMHKVHLYSMVIASFMFDEPSMNKVIIKNEASEILYDKER